jgi:hypothetical protein
VACRKSTATVQLASCKSYNRQIESVEALRQSCIRVMHTVMNPCRFMSSHRQTSRVKLLVLTFFQSHECRARACCPFASKTRRLPT